MFSSPLTPVKGGVSLKQNQSGNALMAWVLIMLLLFSGLTAALNGYSLTSIKTTKRSSDFVIAGQLSNEAVQDAIYQFNEGDIAKFNDASDSEPGVDPARAGTECGVDSSSIDDAIKRGTTWNDKLGCGEYQSAPKAGKWQWTVEDTSLGKSPSNPAPGKRFTVTATGAYGDAKRSVTVNLTSIAATGVRYDENHKIGYSVAPSTAFDFAIFGGSDKVNEGLSWAKGPKNTDNVYIKGEIGSNNLIDINHIPSSIDSTNPEDFKNYTSPANEVPSVGFYNYGTKGWDERCNTTTALEQTKTACQPILRAPQKMVLNADLVNALADKCIGSPYKWVASEQDGILNAGAGNAGCYTEMVFDRDVNVVGTGFFSAFVRGNVTINPGVNIRAMNPANLVIYTSGNVSLSNGAGSTGKELDMFVYAPTGTCELKDSIADMSPVKVVGSLACNNVILEGVSVEWKDAPAGVDQPGFSDPTAPTYSKRIWNADNITEGPSGRIS